MLVIAYVLFVMPLASDNTPDPDTRECPECRSEIWADARRCAFCTSVLPPVAGAAQNLT